MPEWLSPVVEWIQANPRWLAAALLIACFTECLAVVGLLVPGTLLLLALAVVAGSGLLGAGETLALGFLGGFAGDLASYALGRRYHQNIRKLRGLRSHPQWLQRAELYMQQYGVASLLVGRFVGPLRPMLPLTAGMFDMPLPRFLLVSLLASAAWSLVYLLPAWSAGAALRLPLPHGFWREAALLGGALALLLGAGLWASLRQVRHAALVSTVLCAAWLTLLFLGWPRMVEFDQGLMAVLQAERSPGMDRLMVFVTRLGDFDAQLAAGVLLVLLLAALRQWQATLFATLTLLGTAVANGLLKNGIARDRPDVLLTPLESYSLPSGHASAAFALLLTLGVLAGRGQPPRMRLAWLSLACIPATAIALSRLYLGVHWPTDVLAGALLAASFCGASLAAVQWRSPLSPLRAHHWPVILASCLGLLALYGAWALDATAALYRYR